MATATPSMNDPRRAPAGDGRARAHARSQAERIVERIGQWRDETGEVLVVGVDGAGASGKSTIARHVAELVEAALVHSDDFFGVPQLEQSAGTEPLARYYDWRRLASEALGPLRRCSAARFRSTDPFCEGRSGQLIVVEARPVVVLEGVSATSDALAGFVDRRVHVDTPAPIRLRRLRARVPSEEWDAGWLAAEDRYFASRTPDAYDLIVSGSVPDDTGVAT